MNIVKLKFYPYKLKFSSPIITSKKSFNFREGFTVRLTDEKNKFYWGDVAPLPSFGTETFRDAYDKLSELENLINNIDLPEIFNILNSFRLYNFPSVKFGIEQALINFSFINDFKPVTEQFTSGSRELQISGLSDSSRDKDHKTEFNELIEAGIRTFKIKIGKNNFEEDLNCIKAVRELDENVVIRLDINGAWTFREAKRKINKLTEYGIEFIEQPVKDLNDLRKLSKISPIPIAVDESIVNYKIAKEIIESGIFKFVVIKPTVLGSIFDSLKLINLANSKKIKIIVSSSFESMLGKSILFLLAAQSNHNFAHGLIANKIFEKDLFPNPFDIITGKIKFELDNYVKFIEQLTDFEHDNY